jgi:hypothetical protein
MRSALRIWHASRSGDVGDAVPSRLSRVLTPFHTRPWCGRRLTQTSDPVTLNTKTPLDGGVFVYQSLRRGLPR